MIPLADFLFKFNGNRVQNNGGRNWKSKDELVEMEKYRQFTFTKRWFEWMNV